MNNLPNTHDDLFNNIEFKLKQHVKRKKRKRNTTIALSFMTLILTISFSFQDVRSYANKFFSGYILGIQTAIAHNQGTEINKTFSINGINYTFEKIISDETGTVITYDVNKEDCDIEDIQIFTQDKTFNSDDLYPDISTVESDGKNALLFPPVGSNTIKVKIGSALDYSGDDFIVNDVNWEFDATVKKNSTKTIILNREIQLDKGKLLLIDLKLGVLKSTLNYRFAPNINEDIKAFKVNVDIKSKKRKYKIFNNIYCDGISKEVKNTSTQEELFSMCENNEAFINAIDFESIMYDDVDTLELILKDTGYILPVNKEYRFNSLDLPKTFNLLGSEMKVISMTKGKKDSNDRTLVEVELSNNNRSFDSISTWGFTSGNKRAGGYLNVVEKNTINRVDQQKFKIGINRLNELLAEEDRITPSSEYFREPILMKANLDGSYDDLTFKIINVSKKTICGKKIDIKIN
jgi:hypothetical protein